MNDDYGSNAGDVPDPLMMDSAFDMEVYDLLPPVVQKAIANCPLKVSADQVATEMLRLEKAAEEEGYTGVLSKRIVLSSLMQWFHTSVETLLQEYREQGFSFIGEDGYYRRRL